MVTEGNAVADIVERHAIKNVDAIYLGDIVETLRYCAKDESLAGSYRDLLVDAASELERLRKENFALAATQCTKGWGDESGNFHCCCEAAPNKASQGEAQGQGTTEPRGKDAQGCTRWEIAMTDEEWLDRLHGIHKFSRALKDDIAFHLKLRAMEFENALAAEREECAKVADERAADGEFGTWQAQEGLIIAAAIRSRT